MILGLKKIIARYAISYVEKNSSILGPIPTSKIIRNMTTWDPLHASDPSSFQFGDYGLIILNRNITLNPITAQKLWNGASYRSTVDGGTDRWFEYIDKNNIDVKNKFPDSISGDFDSISVKTLDLCKSNGVLVIHTPDQNYTDFQKSLKVMAENCTTKLSCVVVVCDNCGRVDQLIQNLNTLGKTNELVEDFPPLYLLSLNSLTWFIKKGYHQIKIPEYLIKKQLWCAIMPYQPVKNSITTTGLKWNLNKMCVEFGGLISSSNTYSGESQVTIETDSSILWSMGLKHKS